MNTDHDFTLQTEHRLLLDSTDETEVVGWCSDFDWEIAAPTLEEVLDGWDLHAHEVAESESERNDLADWIHAAR